MATRVKWAVLGAAKISRKVIPAMQSGVASEVVAIASRDLSKAKAAASELGVARAYGSYEEAILDREVEAVYIPLPNHLHVPWAIRAAEAGKHVLCEKPIGMNAAECRSLITVRDRTKVKIGEAFMVRTHPQWLRTREIVRSGEIGPIGVVVFPFAYFNTDPQNVRNVSEYGGGAMLDIGCYAVQISRWLFGEEPRSVTASIETDPEFQVDRLASGILQFPSGQCIFTCGTQLARFQRVQILGATGRIEIEIPVNAPNDRPTRLRIDNGADLFGTGIRTEEIPRCDQYTIQADLFSKAIRDDALVPTPLEDSLANMTAVDAVFDSARRHETIHLPA
jgi:predicted dehydrogenase